MGYVVTGLALDANGTGMPDIYVSNLGLGLFLVGSLL